MNRKRLLVIGYTWPEPNTTAAGNRMSQLFHFFLAQGCEITFSSTASVTSLSLDLETLGIQKVPILLNHESFDRFIKDLDPEIVLFDRFLTEEQFGWRVAEFTPKALRILDTEDLHSLRHAREKAFKKGVDFTTDFWLQGDMFKREISSIYRSDISMIISSYEMYLLNDIVKMDESLLVHLPFMLDALDVPEIEALKSFEERTDFICIGNGKHAPNVDAVIWLKTEIWPLIRNQLPEAKLNVYGAYLPARIEQMHNDKEGFLVHGWTSDLKEVMVTARVTMAPLRFGAGLKGKLIDAMCCGTPSVTTDMGAEGIHDDLPFSGRIANDAESIAENAVALYRDPSIWKEAQGNGIQIVNTLYNGSMLSHRFLSKIERVGADLETHRSKNIIGQLLSHQSMASTKYMAKWIEEKNRKG